MTTRAVEPLPLRPVLDRSHPLSKGLVCAIPIFGEGAARPPVGTTDPWARDLARTILSNNDSNVPTHRCDLLVEVPTAATTTAYITRAPYGRMWDKTRTEARPRIQGSLHMRMELVPTAQGKLTFSFIGKVEDGLGGSGQRPIWAFTNVSTGPALLFQQADDTSLLQYTTHDGATPTTRTITSTKDIQDTKAHHWVVVLDVGRQEFWIDGDLEGVRSDTDLIRVLPSGSDNLEFGVSAGGTPLGVEIGDIRVWNRPLSPREINALFADPSAQYRRRKVVVGFVAAGLPATDNPVPTMEIEDPLPRPLARRRFEDPSLEPPLLPDPVVAPTFELFHQPLPTPRDDRFSRNQRLHTFEPILEPPFIEDPFIPAPLFDLFEVFDEIETPRGLTRRLELLDEILPDPTVTDFGIGPQQVDVGFLTGMVMRIRLFRAHSPFEVADEILLDATLEGDVIFPNDPQIFTVDKASSVYFGPLLLELTMMRRPNAPANNDAMFAIRFRKGR